MRFVQPVVLLLGVGMYLGVIAIFLQPNGGADDQWWILVIVGVWNLLMLIATVIAIVDGSLKIRASKARQLAVDAMVAKLASIPFFLVNFAVLVFLFNFGAISFAMGIGMAVWIIVAIGGGLTYLTMLSTSVYAWAAITQLSRERTIGTRLAVLYSILSFLFVTDVAAGVLLFGHSRRRPRLGLVWLLLGAGTALVVVGVLDYFFGFLSLVFPILGFLTMNDPVFYVNGTDWLEWGTPVAVGFVVILATTIVGVVRRSALRLEAQRAATTIDASAESTSSDLVLAG